MLTALVLICSVTLSSCTPSTARQVIRVPGEFSNPSTCFLQGQAYYAATSLARDLRADEIVRVICR